jgi:nucleotidyltransferase substrate binding protein (TIGR01987 family)
MKTPGSPEKTSLALENAAQAYQMLESFLATPAVSDRDKAGVIQAFEFTFELFWKAYQKVAAVEGFSVESPRQALQTAFRLGLIAADEQAAWLQMLSDRNRTAHTYRREVADEVFGRIRDEYRQLFQRSLQRLQSHAARL